MEREIKLLEALKAKGAEILPRGSRLALYGSRARGDFREDSDWDLHILIPGEEKIRFKEWDDYAWPFADVGLDFDQMVNPRVYSYKGWAKRSFLPFYKNVEQDAVILLQT